MKLFNFISNHLLIDFYFLNFRIIYASNGANDPPLGDFLGQFTDELDGHTITDFVSGNTLFKKI